MEGILFNLCDRERPIAHVLGSMAEVSTPVSTISYPPNLKTRSNSSWSEELLEARTLFRVKNGLGNEPMSKIWCAAPSPVGNLVCIVHSVHPSDLVEYIGSADQKFFVSISQFDDIGTGIEFPKISTKRSTLGNFWMPRLTHSFQ